MCNLVIVWKEAFLFTSLIMINKTNPLVDKKFQFKINNTDCLEYCFQCNVPSLPAYKTYKANYLKVKTEQKLP